MLVGACADDPGAEGGPAEEARGACRADCDQQRRGYAGLRLDECHALCDYVLPGIEDVPGCLEMATDKWTCESGVAWSCSTETDVVGTLADPQSCETERDAYERAQCPGG